ncbi:MAG TPA: OmpH family outer membrane protein [Bryobacteraceae bacterium]|jgi:outer membrane protein|nr:OmpH family outer membrane protein [Bryobacteraceae bacterium]
MIKLPPNAASRWKNLFLRAGVVALATAGLASAQVKIAVVNSSRAIAGTAEIKKAQADLESKYKPRQDELARLQQEIQSISTQLQSDKLSAVGQQDLSAQGAAKQRDFQRKEQDLREDVDHDRQEILGRAGQRMNEVVKKLAAEKGLDAVFDSSTMLFFKPALELTDEAITAYDKTYPVK